MKKAALAVLLAASLSPVGSADASHCIVLPPDLPDPSCDWLHTHDVVQLISDTSALLDPMTCSSLATLGTTLPDVDGVLKVTDGGDVYVSGELTWDCPPYEV